MDFAASLRLLALLSTSAGATTFHDPVIQFAIDFAFPGASVCIARPESLRADGQECKGVDFAAVGAVDDKASLFVVVRFTDWWFTMTGYANPTLAGAMTRENAREFVRGWLKRSRNVSTHQPELLVVNGMQVLRFETRSTLASAPFVFLNYVFAGKRGLMGIDFATDAAHLTQMKGLVEPLIASANMPHEAVPEHWTEPWTEPRPESPLLRLHHALGAAAARSFFLVLLLAVPSAVVALVYRVLTKRKPRA